MSNKYINIYNNLVNLTRNKELYKYLSKEDTFSDRLLIFLFHFAFFLKTFKKSSDKKTLQNIFDFIFRQLEVSIREIGYGDASINKKMKSYVNTFYDILSKIEGWSNMSKLDINGNPIFREDGKILKGENYFKPNIKEILEDK